MIAASQLVELVASRVGQPYRLGAKVPKDLPDWSGPWDCAELASWAVYQLTGVLVGVQDARLPPSEADAYSGAWARDAEASVLVDRVDVEAAYTTPGAILVRAPAAPGVSGHVAISTGGGWTVEAYDTAHGVIRGHAIGRRWSHAVRIVGLDYVAGPRIEWPPPHVLTVGSRGELVRHVQIRLGLFGWRLQTDGIFGPLTARAVAEFQSAHHLVPDGEVGPLTLAALG